MTDVLIIGGGIAGTVAAMALQKAGIDSVIYESYPTGADDVGAFLTVGRNGLDALRTLDLDQQVMAAGFPAGHVDVVSGTGKQLGTVQVSGQSADAVGPHTLKRAELYQVLHAEAARRGIRVEHGKWLISVSHEHGVVADFADGTHAEGDLLVGADGIRSTTRSIISPSNPAPRYTGWNIICGYTTDSSIVAPPDAYLMIYGKRAYFGYTTAPTGETWWFANCPAPQMSEQDLADTTAEQWRERLTHTFARDRTPAVKIVQTSGDNIVASNSYDLPSVPTWHTDHMIIIGDAAHAASPTSTQGASMAIEDAVVLAQCLRDLPAPQAFTTYERLRRERVERVVALGASRVGTEMPGLIKRILRDRALPKVLARPRPPSPWLYDHHIDWSRNVTLDLAGEGEQSPLSG